MSEQDKFEAALSRVMAFGYERQTFNVTPEQGYRAVELLAKLAEEGRWANGEWDCEIRGKDAEWQEEANALLDAVGYIPEDDGT